MFRMNKEQYLFIACLLVSIISSFVIFLQLYNEARDPALIGNKGYVSDEIWYVNSARNILRDFFGLNSTYVDKEGYVYYTILFSNDSSRFAQFNNILNYVQERNGSIDHVYSAFPAISIKLPLNEKFDLKLKGVVSIARGYPYPDVNAIMSYYNLEHPPLGKFIIDISMLIIGDYPLAWRLPSILLTASLPIIIFFIVRRFSNNLFAALSSLFILFDTLLFNEGFLALLDVYLAFFIALSLLFAVYERYLLSSIFIGLSASVKLSGIFLVFVILIYLSFYTNYDRKRIVFLSYIIPFFTWFFVNIPLILKLGIRNWFQSVLSALSWHTTPRPGGPPTSLPWEWLYNKNPFYFHFNPTYSASVTVPIYIITFVFLIITPYLVAKKSPKFSLPSLWLLAVFLGYSILPILGNTTLYSFYAFALIPMIYSIFPVNLLELSIPSLKQNLSDMIRYYSSFFSKKFSSDWFSLRFFYVLAMFVSFLLHLPISANPFGFSLYSDIVYSFYPRSGIGTNYLGIPYIDYTYEYPVLDGVLTYIAAMIAWLLHPAFGSYVNPQGQLTFYIIISLFIFIAGYFLIKDMYELSKKTNADFSRILLFPVLPSLLVYGIYNWDLITIALAVRAIKYFIDNRFILSSIMLSLAVVAKLYPLLLLLVFAREFIVNINNRSLIRFFSYISLTLALIILYNLPFMIINYKLWYDGLISYHINWYIEGSWLVLLYLNPFKHNAQVLSLYLVVFFYLLTIFFTQKKNYINKEYRIIESSYLIMALSIFSSYIHTPQQQLLFLPLLLLLRSISLIFIYIMDFLNALVILTWFKYKEIGLLLFGYYPPDELGGVLSYYSFPTMCAIIRDFTILGVSIYILLKNSSGGIRTHVLGSRAPKD